MAHDHPKHSTFNLGTPMPHRDRGSPFHSLGPAHFRIHTMENAYLNRLPNDVRTLVERTEQASGVEITVRVDPSRARGRPNQSDSIACEVNTHGAQLLIPAPDHFPDGSVLHELLHIRRFLVNGVPRIVVCDDYKHWAPELETTLTELDNSLEHLVIVPEELEHRPDRKAYWGKVMIRVLDDLQSANLSNEDRERHALINWVFIRQVLPDHELLDRASVLIERLGVSDQAERLLDAVVHSFQSKERTVQVYFEHLRLSVEAGCLEYIDSHNGTSRQIPLAEVGA